MVRAMNEIAYWSLSLLCLIAVGIVAYPVAVWLLREWAAIIVVLGSQP